MAKDDVPPADPKDDVPPADPKDDVPPPDPKGGKSSKTSTQITVEQAKEQAEAEAKAKLEENAKLASMAESMQFVKTDLEAMKESLSDETNKILARYPGDKNDYIAHEVWVKETIVKEYFEQLKEEEKTALPKGYQKEIAAIKEAYTVEDRPALQSLYEIMQELEEMKEKTKEAQSVLDSKKPLLGLLSEKDYGKLAPDAKRQHDASTSGQMARQQREEQRKAAQKGGK